MESDRAREIERWGLFELALRGPQDGNPFLDIDVSASFRSGDRTISVPGFYDGGGSYKVRFMPDEIGSWTYETESNSISLDGIRGSLSCVAPVAGNRGPVAVRGIYHFAYADGTPYFPFGTTCYAWIHQAEETRRETLESLRRSPFNKLRMCVFPKRYSNNVNEPELYPFEGAPPDSWDFARFNPAFFRFLESRLLDLMALGIEADLILFHPYDEGHWGFDRMPREADERYLRYIVARLAAFRNVWWSMANEYDYMKEKRKEDWDRYIGIVAESDPHRHLLSIHQGDLLYDHWNPLISHASVQLGTLRDTVGAGFGRFKLLRDAYRKPVIYDEVGYEGNLPQRWGRLSAEELVDKFWHAIVSGTYLTHGETFTHPQDIIWWAKGGTLRGRSPMRIAFLRGIVEDSGLEGLEPLDRWWVINGVGRNGLYYLFYFGYERPAEWRFSLPAFKIDVPMGTRFRVDIIDTWNMTVEPLDDVFEITDQDRYCYTCSYNPVVRLPCREFMALRIRKID